MPVPPRLLDATVGWARLNPGEFVSVPCNICGSFEYETIGSILINSFEFFLVRCRQCDIAWRNPLPGQTFYYELYSEHYYCVEDHAPQLADQVGISDSTPETRSFREQISHRVVKTWIDLKIDPFHDNGKPKRFLEIGGGRGYLQRAAAKRGWDATGLEISPHGIKEAISRNMFVLPVPLDELCTRFIPYENYFDLVVFYDFLEHVDDPGRILRMVRYLLANDGVIIFRVPITKDRPAVHLIDHIWHFSETSLPMLLCKEGFEVWHAHVSGTFKPKTGSPVENVTIYARKGVPSVTSMPLEVKPNPLGKIEPMPRPGDNAAEPIKQTIQPQKTPKLFISHADAQKDMAQQLAEELESAGYRVWTYERDCSMGSYLRQTAEAIEECDVFVLLVSQISLNSRQVEVELVHAHEEGKAMLPLLVDINIKELHKHREWRQALGAANAVSVPSEGIRALIPWILDALSKDALRSAGDEPKTNECAWPTRSPSSVRRSPRRRSP